MPEITEPKTFEDVKKRWTDMDNDLLKEFDFYFGNQVPLDARLLLLEKRFMTMMGVVSLSLNRLIDLEKAKEL